jgi:hypothetical protein
MGRRRLRAGPPSERSSTTMGIFDFIKDIGRKLDFDRDKDDKKDGAD